MKAIYFPLNWKTFCIVYFFVTITSSQSDSPIEVEEFEVLYSTPAAPAGAYLAETFDNLHLVSATWVKSNAKKSDVDADIAKYDGEWSVEPAEKDALPGDMGLVLKSKAKHAAISAHLKKPFVFKNKPLVVQYEVNLQNGQDCGGSYIKLLSQPKKGDIDLENFQDKTPYTIMFGPDKCGNDHKFHFIFRHVNPLNGSIEEKHCKKPKHKMEEPFKDKRPHLYTLIIRPDNTYEILLDNEEMNKGSLMEDFTPSINPPKEINDPEDSRPSDWDDRETIADPTASKPEDWDEDAPRKITDEYADKPDGWLEDEPKLINDHMAEKPEDWDDEMDGEWAAPLVNNPACESAPGCGPWSAPQIANPNYKGKWRPEMINNPNYAGKWAPRIIPNPGYYEDLEPFKMTPIGAVGIELWSMSDNIYFDNLFVSDDPQMAKKFAALTFDLKVFKIDKGQKGYIRRIVDYSNENPWVYGLYVLLLAIPAVVIFLCCCSGESKESKDADRKKTDEAEEDDPHDDEKEEEGEVENEEEEKEGEGEEDDTETQNDENVSEDEKEEAQPAEQNIEEKITTRSSPRLSKSRRE